MHRLLTRGGLAVGLGALAAACARQPVPELALTCQTMTCVCLPAEPSFPAREQPAEVQWRANGDAYCPEGYVLRPAPKKKK